MKEDNSISRKLPSEVKDIIYKYLYTYDKDFLKEISFQWLVMKFRSYTINKNKIMFIDAICFFKEIYDIQNVYNILYYLIHKYEDGILIRHDIKTSNLYYTMVTIYDELCKYHIKNKICYYSNYQIENSRLHLNIEELYYDEEIVSIIIERLKGMFFEKELAESFEKFRLIIFYENKLKRLSYQRIEKDHTDFKMSKEEINLQFEIFNLKEIYNYNYKKIENQVRINLLGIEKET